jgi:hypothetical protein
VFIFDTFVFVVVKLFPNVVISLRIYVNALSVKLFVSKFDTRVVNVDKFVDRVETLVPAVITNVLFAAKPD